LHYGLRRPDHPGRSPAYDNNRPESGQIGACEGLRGDRGENDISDFIHVSALSASHAQETSNQHIFRDTDAELATVVVILCYHNYIVDRERLSFICLFYLLTGCLQRSKEGRRG
jgi:hypothetical protein